jgi:hypothetical protein
MSLGTNSSPRRIRQELNHYPGPGNAPATGLSMREIGMNPGRSARFLGAGEMAAGALSAGIVMRGSGPLGERTGGGGSGPSSGGWVAFRSPAGSPRLERMYYDCALSSRLFRTNFLNSLFGAAGAG